MEGRALHSEFKDKVVVVTGGTRGVGKGIVEHFRELGSRVLVCGWASDDTDLRIDLSQPAAAARLYGVLVSDVKRLDVLINNARGTARQKLGQESEIDWDSEMSIGVRTPYFLAKYLMPLMPAGSSIVNIGSVTSYTVSGESAAYQVSKGAQLQLTRVLAQLGASRGIRCNAVLPGAIVKGGHKYLDELPKVHFAAQHGTPEDVAYAVEFLASSRAKFINGVALPVDGGLLIHDAWQVHLAAKGLTL